MRKNIIKIAAFSMVAILLFVEFNILLKPKRPVEIAVDNYHDEHVGMYQLDENTLDVLYLGSSHSFSSISPEDIYKKYGITGYVQGSSCQKLWQSYYYLEEALYTQHPQVVVLDTFMALDGNVQSEAFNREAIDKLKMSRAKIRSAWTVYRMNPDGEDIISYIFPAFRYHDRWKELSEQDFKYMCLPSDAPAKGFLARIGTVPCEFNSADYESNDLEVHPLNSLCVEYLNKIKDLCDANDIDLMLVKYPTCLWNNYNSITIQRWADMNGVTFLDFNANDDLREEVNIDWSVDSLDGGNHLNYDGAMKMSDWMGKYLVNHYTFSDKRTNPQYSIWETDYDYYKKCVLNYQISLITDFERYLSTLEDGGYIVILTIDRIHMPSWMDTYGRLLSMGVTEDILSNSLMNANICILSTENKEVIYEAVDDEILYYNGYLESLVVRVTASVQDEVQTFSCICDKQEVARDQDGLQMVVLDPITNTYVETSVWLVSETGAFSRS